MISEGSCDWIL